MVHDGLTQPVQRQADVRGGDRGRRRARDHARRPGQLGAALARAHDRRHRRRAACPRRSSPVTIKGRKGDTVVEVDEAPAPRHHARGARQAARPDGQGRLAHGRQLARASTTARARSCWPPRTGPSANGKESLAEIVAQAAVADEFAYLARTPANAALKALDKAGLQPGDIDLWEINEAFASVTLNSIRMLGIDEERVNVNGGAVAHRPSDRRVRRAHPRHARARAAPARRRLRLRGDLLGRRPGRRGHRPRLTTVTERPHILPPPPGGRRTCAGPTSRGAAFFDLDRTLIAGSSAFQFGRVAYRTGSCRAAGSRADAWENLRFRLHGLDGRGHRRRARAGGRDARGRARARPRSGSRPPCSPACSRACTRACSRSPTSTRTPGRPIFICTAAAQEMAELMAHRAHLRRRGRLASPRWSTATTRARPGGPFTYREGKAAGDPRARRARGHRPAGLVGVLRLGVRPADAAARRPSRRGQPGRGARRAWRARRAGRSCASSGLGSGCASPARRWRRRARRRGSALLVRRSAPRRRAQAAAGRRP